MEILFITVGGSCAPIIKSIKEHAPNRIVFICSDKVNSTPGSYKVVIGNGSVCGPNTKQPTEPNILTQLGLSIDDEGEKFLLQKIKDFDDLNVCFQECYRIMSKMRERHPNAQFVVDYTGGTKSMGVGLVMAAISFPQVQLSVVTGHRIDLMKVVDQTETVRPVLVPNILVRHQEKMVRMLLEKFYFASAIEMLESMIQTPGLPPDLARALTHVKSACQGFKVWDEFDHIAAWRFLNLVRAEFYKPWMSFLEGVIHSRARCDETWKIPSDLKNFSKKIKNSCGYEIVKDLLLNAERRSLQGRYDDAVG